MYPTVVLMLLGEISVRNTPIRKIDFKVEKKQNQSRKEGKGVAQKLNINDHAYRILTPAEELPPGHAWL